VGVASRNVFDANVYFYGDVKGDDTPLEDHDMRAWVDLPDTGARLDETDVDPAALLPPLLATSTLYLNAKAASYFIDPLNGALRDFAELLLESEDEAREAGLAEDIQFTMVLLPTDDMWSSGLTDLPIPRAVQESEGQAPRRTRLSLMQLRGSGGYWGRSRAPSRGGQPYFANSALLLLIQHIAKTRDYERAVVPMAAGLSAFIALVDMAEDEAGVDEGGWRVIGKDVYKFNDPIREVVLADDPRQELRDFSAESEPDD
jgi:hypothetical protein